jgi:hypothetical protein
MKLSIHNYSSQMRSLNYTIYKFMVHDEYL